MAGPDDLYRVLIIGGGPAGLLTAQALQKRGIRCTVFEQDAALDARPRDWNFGIYWAQAPLDDCLPHELSQLVIAKGQVDERPLSADDYMPIYNGRSGELLKKVPAPNNIRLHRRNFLRLLAKDVDIQYGKRLQRVESDGRVATAYFEDGTSEAGNLLIGAEGAHSKVREYLLGEEQARPDPSPIMASATMAKLPKEVAMQFQKEVHPRYAITFHPEGEFTWIGVHDAFSDTQPGDWQFMIIQSWLPAEPHDPSSLQGDAILPDMKRRAKSHAEPFQTFIASIPEGTKCWHNQLSYWIPRPWDNHNSTVTLIGDAAHPMTFRESDRALLMQWWANAGIEDRGQGLNNSIHDVASLAKLLSEKGTSVQDGKDSAVDLYEREMLQRGKEAVIGSNENSMSIHQWEKLLQSPLFTSGLSKPPPKRAEPNGTDVKT